ncbi:hypothetical protein ACFMPD_02250 [Sedimentitalea sp. HM32M-2]|uniref:hypothetical protein n=1 Tax=Sedimentitalea sp. HM32M-2 TaxID=3351566 RepID=UPI0036361755
MLGLVMWSDKQYGKAVIWCEDHGDLAFYRRDKEDPVVLTAGDWVEFDEACRSELRVAENPRLVNNEGGAMAPVATSPCDMPPKPGRERIDFAPMRRIFDLRRAEEFRELGLCRAEA